MLQIQDDPFSPERVELHPLAVVQAPGFPDFFRKRQGQGKPSIIYLKKF